MTSQELIDLQAQATKDTDLTPIARVLFAEIINLNLTGDGCYKAYTTLAEELGMSERTVRRRRKELQSSGYITVSHREGRRYLVPTRPDKDVRSGHECPDTDDRADSDDRTQVSTTDIDDESAPDTDVQDQEVDNPEGASSRAREAEGRWDFLPDYRMRHLPEIKSEAGSPDHNPVVQSIAARYLNRSHDDLAGTVDWHLEQRSEDEVIAAYVIAGREADSPLEYADTIIREGWKESTGGDGVSRQLPDDDQDVIYFGSTR